jgi:GT2 family glycosyltransferase
MDDDGVRISVVISTRNRVAALAHCLAALRSGERLPDEIVVVDQGDVLSAAAVVEAFREEGGPPVNYLAQPPLGLGAAQNAGVRAAVHAWIAVTDDDCLPDRHWLATIAAVAATGRIDVITGRVLAAPPAGEKTLPVATRTSAVAREFAGRSPPWHVGSGNNFAVRRSTYLEIGGCDERLGPGSPAHGGVDMDLFYRLLGAGARARYEPAALVLHERQSEADRRLRRPMYGFGMGACFGLWLRQRDGYVLPLTVRWVLLRLARMVRPRDVPRSVAIREELLILASTAQGFAYGMRTAPAAHGSRETDTGIASTPSKPGV